MSALERAMIRARTDRARVVFPEMHDPRIAEAVARMQAEGICTPVPLADTNDALVAVLVKARGMKQAVARRMLSRPLYRAAAMVAAGAADAMLAGAVNPSKKVIEAAQISIGLADGVALPSSFFLMRFPDGRELIFADCALNVTPDAAALTEIARASETTGKALLGQARVALLSFSTGASGVGDSVDKVRAAAVATDRKSVV